MEGYYLQIIIFIVIIIVLLTLKELFFPRKPKRRQRVKILTPKELIRGYGDCKDYYKYKNWEKYKSTELTPYVDGRRVKFWKLVHSADDEEGDDYVPIFYKKKRKGRREEEKVK